VTFFRQSCLLLALVLLVSVCKAAPYTPETPTHKVATLYTTWHDTARARDVPVKIYYPADAKSPCPVIIFSHGLGGSREGYGYLGETWAGCGYISVHIQHQGSDDAVWRNANGDGFAALSRAVTDPQNALNRALDVPFAIDQMLALNKNPKSPLYGLINADEIGMAGHSFGAWTTLAVTGEKTVAPDNLVDPRIKAAIAMSAPVVGGGAKAVGQFTDIKVPVFHMTGTRDDSPIGDTTAPERRIPYDQSTIPGTCLLILNGADHMTFSGHIMGISQASDTHFQSIILPASIAFWDAHLRNDQEAAAWLYKGPFAKFLGTQGTFETR